MKLKTSVVSFDAHVPPGVKCLQYSKMTKKMYSVHVDNSVVKWDASFAFVTVSFCSDRRILFRNGNYRELRKVSRD